MNYAVQQRLRFIDTMLKWYGSIGRGVLADHFGISTVQASHDIRDYLQRAPLNATYCTSSKAYLKTEHFTPLF